VRQQGRGYGDPLSAAFRRARCLDRSCTSAVLPSWEAWSSRRGLLLTYGLTQMLAGHGLFGEYLTKVGREAANICHHCGEGSGTAQHTLEFCPEWELPCYTLRLVIGERLAPSAIVEAKLSGPQEHEAVRAFCGQVMLVIS
jgi:hypothetical protein